MENCKHEPRYRESYGPGVYKCWNCGDIIIADDCFIEQPKSKINKWFNDPEPWQIVVMIGSVIALFIGIVITINFLFYKTVYVKGTVLSHTVTSTKSGYAKYHTIARFEDGYIRDLEGLNNYVKPVGATVIYETQVLK
jgi:hypothetical protein